METLYILDNSETIVAVINPNDKEAPFIEATHIEQINGENSFRFIVPANHSKSEFIIEGNYIAFRDLDDDLQLFEIKIVEEMHEETLYKSVFCEHSAFEMLDDLVLFSNLRNQTANTILTSALQNSRWDVGIVTVVGVASVRIEINNPIEVFQKMVEAFDGGEFKYRVIVSGNQITNRFVDFLVRRGADTGRRFEYSKDITSIKREVDITNLKTALYGFGQAQEVPGGIRRLRFDNIAWSIVGGDLADKPLGDEYIVNPTALAQFGRDGGTRNRFGYLEDSEETDPERLLNNTWRELLKVSTPRATYEMAVFDLAQATGISAYDVRLGDTVAVIDNEFKPELRILTRVVEYRRNLIENEKNEIILNNFVRLITQDGQTLRSVETRINSNQGVWQDSSYNNNMVSDAGFDAVPLKGLPGINQDFQVDTDTHDAGNFFWWIWNGTDPRIVSTIGTGLPTMALFNQQAALIKTQSNPMQYCELDTELGLDGPYTFSFYASAHPGTIVNGIATLEVYAVNEFGFDIQKMGQAEINIIAGEDYKWKRGQVTIYNLPINTELLRISIFRDSSTPNLEYLADGIQGVAKDKPSTFLSDKELFRFYNGLAGAAPKNLQVRDYAQIGYNPSFSNFNFELSETGLFITRNNSQFSTAHSPAQVIPANTFTKVNFNGLVFVDWHNEFDNVNSQFIPNEDGTYIFSASLRITGISSGSTVALRLMRNGVEDTRFLQIVHPSGGADTVVIQGNALVFAVALQPIHIEVYVQNAGASTVLDSLQSFLKAFRIGGRR